FRSVAALVLEWSAFQDHVLQFIRRQVARVRSRQDRQQPALAALRERLSPLVYRKAWQQPPQGLQPAQVGLLQAGIRSAGVALRPPRPLVRRQAVAFAGRQGRDGEAVVATEAS